MVPLRELFCSFFFRNHLFLLSDFFDKMYFFLSSVSDHFFIVCKPVIKPKSTKLTKYALLMIISPLISKILHDFVIHVNLLISVS